ncbi:hypothetical protein FB107DRAFT_280739 [Schizophyllum commune]
MNVLILYSRHVSLLPGPSLASQTWARKVAPPDEAKIGSACRASDLSRDHTEEVRPLPIVFSCLLPTSFHLPLDVCWLPGRTLSSPRPPKWRKATAAATDIAPHVQRRVQYGARAATTRRQRAAQPPPPPPPPLVHVTHALRVLWYAPSPAHAVALARADRRVTWQCHVMRVNRANAWAAGCAHLDAHDRQRWVFRPLHMSTPRYAAGLQSRTTATWRVDRILAMSGSAGLRLREAVALRGRPAPQHGADAQARMHRREGQ